VRIARHWLGARGSTDCCTRRGTAMGDDAAPVLRRALRLVDDRFGVVGQMMVHDVGPGDPPFFFATAELASTIPFSDGVASRLNGGAGLDAESATIAALGEAIERYSIGIYRAAELVRASADELGDDAV